MNSDVLLLFSYETYPKGSRPYINHAKILNDIQGASPKLTFYFGALADLIFLFDGHKMSITEPHTGRDLTSFAHVFFQKWMVLPQFAFATAIYLDHENVDFMGHEVLHQNPNSKLAELLMLAYANMPYPKTVVAPLPSMLSLLDAGKVPFSYPFILKDIVGSQGKDNHLVQNRRQLVDIMTASPHITFMAQEFIKNDCDYRVAIMGGEVKYVLRRTRKEGTHVNNTSQGAEAEFMPIDHLPADIMRDVLKAAEATYRTEFSGTDVLIDPQGKHWILEVNESPEIQTGFDSPRKSKILVDYLAERISSQSK